jgi:arylsulfatase A-like enzyme
LNRDRERPHHAMFADMVRYADRLIGDLVQELEQAGLRERTIVFVATDNGTEKSLTARSGGRDVQGGLYQLNEAGGNVGLLANCPRLIPGGRTLPLADFSDLLPTFCELAGVPLPRDRAIDGQSLAAVLRSTSAAPPRSWIFNQYGSLRVVRDQRYKLYSDGRFYDLRDDRDERRDLSGGTDAELAAAKHRLHSVLSSLSPDAPPPFVLRSQSAFRLKQQSAR